MHEAAGRLVTDLSLFWQLHGHHFESLANVRRVLRATPQSPGPLRARLLQTVGQLGIFAMDRPGGYGVSDTSAAIEMATALGRDDVLSRALGIRGFMTVFAAPQVALQTLSEAHAAAKRAGDRFGLIGATASAGFAAMFGWDRPDLAAPHLAELAAEAKVSGSPLWKIWHGLTVGIGQWRAGRLAEAISTLAAAESLGWVLGDPTLESWCAVYLADAHVDRGDYAAAERIIARSASWMDRSSFGRLELVLSRRVRLELRRGELAAATTTLDTLEDFACAAGFPFLIIELKSMRARLALQAGDMAAALLALDQADASAVGLGTPWYRAAVANLEGRVRHAQGDPSAAEDAHHRALALCVEYGFAAVAAETLEQLASVAAAGESWSEAGRLYGAAAALREHTGSKRAAPDEPAVAADLAAARTVLGEDEFEAVHTEGFALNLAAAAAYASRTRGERKRPSAGWESLTPTELQVVDLVAQGRTNAQIADKLFIAPGTVKIHVHHIFTKLGITRRAALATRATERRLTDP
jgi:DNA-binding CsgD family transcriptional regulator